GETFGEIIDTYYKPDFRFTAEIIGAVVGKPAEDRRVRFAVMALGALIDAFGLYGRLMEAVDPELAEDCRNSDQLAKRIVTMAVAAAGEAGED
ncbi:MAG: CerR family C-terminal domain-containing protein, partial [Acidobacteriota bacterium]|nr:CerR family C-terminal domain-containing protein [Acidobacteriota bacterium]